MRPCVTTPNLLRPSDDPTGKAKKMDKEWIISEKIQFGRQVDGKIQRCNAMMIRPGDFVDVTAIAQIFTYNGAGGRDAHVSFAMTRVVQLKAAEAVRIVRPSSPALHALPDRPSVPRSITILLQRLKVSQQNMTMSLTTTEGRRRYLLRKHRCTWQQIDLAPALLGMRRSTCSPPNTH